LETDVAGDQGQATCRLRAVLCSGALRPGYKSIAGSLPIRPSCYSYRRQRKYACCVRRVTSVMICDLSADGSSIARRRGDWLRQPSPVAIEARKGTTKRSAMGVLMIKCPDKGKEFSTGIEIEPEHVRKLPDVLTFTQCPYCRVVHGWRVADAWLHEEKQILARRRSRVGVAETGASARRPPRARKRPRIAG